jgi:polysaccharide deacetylase family protein (PEP-CTERM system associated)
MLEDAQWPGPCGVALPTADVPDGLAEDPGADTRPCVILSFDVEEHDRIEAAAQLPFDPARRAYYGGRVRVATRWLLDELARHDIRATFFVVGQIARDDPALVRAIHRDGHEVASHSWDHRRLHHHDPASFRADVLQSKDALEQVTGAAVVGYRAPTFSVVRQTAWALDVLAELEMAYDSSVYPVLHDRYGVPRAPRGPFLAAGPNHTILELPPATWRVLGMNLPTGGGGYFRLLPLWFLRQTLRQMGRRCRPPVAMLYFHPWEFDPGQARLPLGRAGRFRTYAGIGRSRARLTTLLGSCRFTPAVEVVKRLSGRLADLPLFQVGA